MTHKVDAFGLPVSHAERKNTAVLTTAFPSKPPEREFIPTLIEWAAKNKEQIIVSDDKSSSAGITQNLYTVAETKTLYITSAFIMLQCDTGSVVGDNAVWCALKKGGSSALDNHILNVGMLRVANVDARLPQTATISFPMPLRFEAGETLDVQFDGNYSSPILVAFAGFTGWLEDKPIN